jgi:hypothetical protein
MLIVIHAGVFFQFCDLATVVTIHKRKQPNLATGLKEDGRHFLQSCYVLATSKNPVSKYCDFHVFFLRMWWSERHLKRILWQHPKKSVSNILHNLFWIVMWCPKCDASHWSIQHFVMFLVNLFREWKINITIFDANPLYIMVVNINPIVSISLKWTRVKIEWWNWGGKVGCDKFVKTV